MTNAETLALVGLGAAMGATGQIFRAVVGIKKQMDDAGALSPPRTAKEWFNGKQLFVSLLLGACAGVVAAVTQYEVDLKISKELLLGFAGAGYAGSDFVEGLFQKWLPK